MDFGRELLKIIHDVAPGAELLFHSYNISDFGSGADRDEELAQAIEAMVKAGANAIMVDPRIDRPRENTLLFQDTKAAQAINKAVEQGVTVVTPAGDKRNQAYESQFRAGETFSLRGITYEAHDFDLGKEIDSFQKVELEPNARMRMILQWQQSPNNVTSDYQILLVDKPLLPGQGSKILASSFVSNSDTDKPSTYLSYQNGEAQTAYLMLIKQQNTDTKSIDNQQPDVIKWINASPEIEGFGKTFFEYVDNEPGAVGANSIHGTANAKGAITAGAGELNLTDGSVSVKPFSDNGGSTIAFDPEGNPLENPEIPSKPDIIAPTGESNQATADYLDMRESTLSAAAHTVGAIALMLQRAGGGNSLTPQQIREILQQTDIPVIPQPNLPQDTGFLQANGAVLQSSSTQIRGTGKDDKLQGKATADNLYGLGGNDRIRGNKGFDVLFGGNGDDLLNGNQGNDYLQGELGNDTLRGGAGDDFLSGGVGSDRLIGGGGVDKFFFDGKGKVTIADFQLGKDNLVLPVGVKFSDLKLQRQKQDTIIKLPEGENATLLGISPSQITADDVISLPNPRQAKPSNNSEPPETEEELENDESPDNGSEPEEENPEEGNSEPIVSEGDRAMRSDVARKLFGLNGEGIKIGVISDSFDAFEQLNQDIKNGELPGVNNPFGKTQPVNILQEAPEEFFTIDEGRAMAQIIHDTAPDSELLFHSVIDSEGSVTDQTLADAIQALADAGADVIVDDFGTYTPFFQDGIAAQKVNKLARQGITYVSSAGNDGNNSYQSPFRGSKTFDYRGIEYQLHDFDPGSGVDLFQSIKFTGEDATQIFLQFQWQQKFGEAATDFQVFMLDRPQLPGEGGQIVSASQFLTPDSANDPSLAVITSSAVEKGETVYLAISKKTASADPDPGFIKWLDLSRNFDLTYEYVNDKPGATPGGTVYGHPNAEGAIAVGAAEFNKTPEFNTKPAQVNDFSSNGGSPIFFTPDGKELDSPQIRDKPDIIGLDGVSTSVPLFEQFFGTSASAPGVAATIALMLQRAGGPGSLTPEQIRTKLRATDVPVTSQPNLPKDSGLIQADGAVLNSATIKQTGTENNDSFRGTAAAENFSGLAGDDLIHGGDGFDALTGGNGNDSLLGEDSNDYLLGEAGDDTLSGGKGQDFLFGGKGTNYLSGGSEADIFQLDRNAMAIVSDFQNGIDQLVLPQGIDFADTNVTQQGKNTLLAINGNTLTELTDIQATTITADNFITV
ncbi:conserved hypothetical protein [Hyella patelloides LEGE 07179]|uniref:Peptidase S8/S53 domain-containing protein n=1 Tax=Hyella patelloides LEGE 07179 TaxID=945734 RepID=A0A563W2N3_9CYAN|nr:S8 family serine peptidase [Hyella patelloides]VEP17895.1 conserved hypothetical protein [Hyella patelloides LEGE 07179]